MAVDYFKYLRKEKMPHIWCAGCGHGMIVKSIIRAIDKLGWKNNEIALVSGIGCSSRTPGYLDFHTLHTTHGRALAFATGIKLARPNLKVIVVGGDGDMMAIGGNHFIHACRRNIDIKLVVYNNNIYGMTGGQASPTTLTDAKATTAPYGFLEEPFDVCNMAIASGASFVGRALDLDVPLMDRVILESFKHKGFSVVDAWSQCPTYFGRFNRWGNPSEMMEKYKQITYNIRQKDQLSEEEKKGKYPVGILHQIERPEFCEKYEKLIENLKTKEEAE